MKVDVATKLLPVRQRKASGDAPNTILVAAVEAEINRLERHGPERLLLAMVQRVRAICLTVEGVWPGWSRIDWQAPHLPVRIPS